MVVVVVVIAVDCWDARTSLDGFVVVAIVVVVVAVLDVG